AIDVSGIGRAVWIVATHQDRSLDDLPVHAVGGAVAVEAIRVKLLPRGKRQTRNWSLVAPRRAEDEHLVAPVRLGLGGDEHRRVGARPPRRVAEQEFRPWVLR